MRSRNFHNGIHISPPLATSELQSAAPLRQASSPMDRIDQQRKEDHVLARLIFRVFVPVRPACSAVGSNLQSSLSRCCANDERSASFSENRTRLPACGIRTRGRHLCVLESTLGHLVGLLFSCSRASSSRQRRNERKRKEIPRRRAIDVVLHACNDLDKLSAAYSRARETWPPIMEFTWDTRATHERNRRHELPPSGSAHLCVSPTPPSPVSARAAPLSSASVSVRLPKIFDVCLSARFRRRVLQPLLIRPA